MGIERGTAFIAFVHECVIAEKISPAAKRTIPVVFNVTFSPQSLAGRNASWRNQALSLIDPNRRTAPQWAI